MKGRKEGVAQHLFFIKSLINIILAYIEQPKHHAVMLHTHLVGTQPIKKKRVMNKLFKIVHFDALLYASLPSKREICKRHTKFILALC